MRGALSLVLSISTIVLPATSNLIILSLAPSVNSAVTRVLPSKSSTPLRPIQLTPLWPSNLVRLVLYLIWPATPLGRWAVVPTGSFNAPVELICTYSVLGCNIKSPVVLITLLLKLKSSNTILPVPFARNSKLLLLRVVVI